MTESELVQHLSQTHIDYDAPAKLYDMKLQPDMVSARRGETFHGTLAGAVRRFMALQPGEAAFASLVLTMAQSRVFPADFCRRAQFGK
jgi:hypothetical protein